MRQVVQRSKIEALGALAFAGSALALALTAPWSAAVPVETSSSPGTVEPAVAPASTPAPVERPVIDVVFVLDTTGSMSGLLEGAKQKIWSIANTIASGQPQPQLRVGLVAYRDRGDAYVTQTTPITEDLDEVYGALSQLDANGGGDFPEHLNAGLKTAIRDTQWSTGANTLKMVFVVGDAPPHDDYDPSLTSAHLAAEAMARGIVLNAVQCGNDARTRAVFERFAAAANGEFMAIAANGGVSMIATPFDEELARLNTALGDLGLDYGGHAMKARGGAKKRRRKAMRAGTAADAASYGAKKKGLYKEDLVTAIREGDVTLDSLSDEELPTGLAGKSRAEQQKMLESNMVKREALRAQIRALSRQRDTFLEEEKAARAAAAPAPGALGGEASEGFDDTVKRAVRTSAKDLGIEYK